MLRFVKYLRAITAVVSFSKTILPTRSETLFDG